MRRLGGFQRTIAEEKLEELSDDGTVHEPAFGWFRLGLENSFLPTHSSSLSSVLMDRWSNGRNGLFYSPRNRNK